MSTTTSARREPADPNHLLSADSEYPASAEGRTGGDAENIADGAEDRPRPIDGNAASRALGLRARLSAFLLRQASLHKGLLSIFDQALVSGTSFATVVIISRACSTAQLGIFYLTLTIILVLIGIQENVIAAPYTIFGARRRGNELAEYTGSMWVHHLILTVASVVSLLAILVASAAAGATEVVPGLWALVVFGPIVLLREGIRRFAFARLSPGSAIAIDATVSIVQLAGLLALGMLGLLSVVVVISVMGCAGAVACLGWYAWDRPQVRFVRGRFLSDWLHNWSFAKWSLTGYLVGSTTPYIMPWILNLAAGPTATGVLGACGTLIGISNILIVGSANFLTPKSAQAFAASGVSGLRRVLVVAGALFLLVLGTLCVAILATGDWLPVAIYGGKYGGCGAVLAILAASALATSVSVVAGNGLWALGQPRLNFLADGCTLIATLAASVCLVFPFGVVGAALATLVGTSTGAVVRIQTLRRAMASASIPRSSVSTVNPHEDRACLC